MGMYTELVLKCSTKANLPDDVKAVLNCLFRGHSEPENLPDHAFFKCLRWACIGQTSSFYHHPKALSDYWTGFPEDLDNGGYIFSRSDLKNYDDEIEHFVDWFMPYIEEDVGQCIGWQWYEEDKAPTLLFKLAGEIK